MSGVVAQREQRRGASRARRAVHTLGRMPPTAVAEKAEPSPVVERRITARHLYWQGWRLSSIAEFLRIPRSTIQE